MKSKPIPYLVLYVVLCDPNVPVIIFSVMAAEHVPVSLCVVLYNHLQYIKHFCGNQKCFPIAQNREGVRDVIVCITMLATSCYSSWTTSIPGFF